MIAALRPWLPVALGAGLVYGVASLLHRNLRPTLETGRYVDEIHAATDQAGRNLEAMQELAQTKATVESLADLAAAYAEHLRRQQR